MLTISIHGSGCASRRKLEVVALEVAAGACSEDTFVEITEIMAIMSGDLLARPGLAIYEKLVSSGRIPKHAGIGARMAG